VSRPEVALPITAMADLLTNRGFRAFWIANLISNLGTSAFVLAINWLTVKQYGALGIATLALAYGVPQLLLQLVGGTLSDRINRRHLFAITETAMLLMAALMLLASLRGVVPLWLLALVNGCNGAISAFDTPARTALITDMVPRGQVVVAQQLYTLSANLTNVFGPALGGILLSLGPDARSHEEIAFAFNALSFLPLLGCIPFLPSLQPELGGAAQRMPFLRSLREGLSFVRHRQDLRTLLALLALVMLLGMPFQGLLPVFVNRHLSLDGGHGFYAALLSAVGLGAFVGSLLGIGLGEGRRPGLLLSITAAGLGGAVLLLVGSGVIHWASLAAFLAGACGNLTIGLDNALLQGGTPEMIQGRVNAIANLSKGLQSFSVSAASYQMHRLSSLGHNGIGYQLVQAPMAIALLIGVALLWPRLGRLAPPVAQA
jgi:MFS family permease